MAKNLNLLGPLTVEDGKFLDLAVELFSQKINKRNSAYDPRIIFLAIERGFNVSFRRRAFNKEVDQS